MTTRIAILDDYVNAALGLAPWDSLPDCQAVVFDTYISGGDDRVANALQEFDVVVCMRERTRLPAAVIDRLPRLKLIITTGARNASIDGAAARKRGIPVCGSPLIGFAAGEHAWGLVMALARRIPMEDRAMKTGGWQKEFPVTMGGKTLGILGFGRLGKQVAGYGVAFGMKVIAWSPSLTDATAAERGVARVERDRLFTDSDFLSIQVTLNQGTRGSVGARELGMMKPTAYLVNTSRGPIVDEADSSLGTEDHRRSRSGCLRRGTLARRSSPPPLRLGRSHRTYRLCLPRGVRTRIPGRRRGHPRLVEGQTHPRAQRPRLIENQARHLSLSI